MSLYALKPRFQDLLRPVAAAWSRMGLTANMVTMAAMIGSVVAGAAIAWLAAWRPIFLFVPAWFLIRMALNAIDGMMAREFHQKSVLGAYLNEIGDVVSDAALYAPFARLAWFGGAGIALVIALSIMTECAGVVGSSAGVGRRYDGPLGKSDRALVFGAIGAWVGCSAPTPAWFTWAVPLLAFLLVLTIVNRVRGGIGEATRAQC